MTSKSAKQVRKEIRSRRTRSQSRSPRPDLQLIALPGERDPAEGGDDVVDEALRHDLERTEGTPRKRRTRRAA